MSSSVAALLAKQRKKITEEDQQRQQSASISSAGDQKEGAGGGTPQLATPLAEEVFKVGRSPATKVTNNILTTTTTTRGNVNQNRTLSNETEGVSPSFAVDLVSSPVSLGGFSLLPQSNASAAAEVPPPIVPFGEYVRRILGLRAESDVGKLAARCATLYIFRNNPVQLQDLMALWCQRAKMTCRSLRTALSAKPISIATSSCIAINPDSCALDSSSASSSPAATAPHDFCPFDDDASTGDQWVNHMLTILQNCVERYFSKNWNLQKQLVAANTEYRQFQENNDQYLPSGSAASKGSPSIRRGVGGTGGGSSSRDSIDSVKIIDQLASSFTGDYAPPKPLETPPVTPRGGSTRVVGTPSSPAVDLGGVVTPTSSMPIAGLNGGGGGALSPPPPPLHNRRPSFQVPTGYTWLTSLDFDDYMRLHDTHGAVVIFHAEFSEPSCELLRLLHSMRKKHCLRMHGWEKENGKHQTSSSCCHDPIGNFHEEEEALRSTSSVLMKDHTGAFAASEPQQSPSKKESSPPITTSRDGERYAEETRNTHHTATPPPYFPEIFAVDATNEFELFKRFDIQWFPTMIFFHEKAHHVYPSKGVIRQPQFLEEWFEQRGKETETKRIHTKKLKNFVTKAAMLQANKRYVGARQLATTVMMLQRLQCSSGSCGSQDGSQGGTPRTATDPPVFIFLGGGMAAGKTTAVTWLTRSDWWKKHGQDTVTVDADAFKHADPLFNSQASDLHKRSTEAAEQLLVQAVNEGRDIIFDGTMMWEPFVRQTVNMVRNSRKHIYKRGPGYNPAIHDPPGAPEEEYWSIGAPQPEGVQTMTPYLVQLIGVSVDPKVGVLRAILRQLASGRSVPVQAQLRSYRFFAQHFEEYARMCDDVILFNNNVHVDLEKGQSPVPMARKELGQQELSLLDEMAWHQFLSNQELNDSATCAEEVLPNHPGSATSCGGDSIRSMSRQGSTLSLGAGSGRGNTGGFSPGVGLVRLDSDGGIGSSMGSSDSLGV